MTFRQGLPVLFILAFLLVLQGPSLYAQKGPTTLTLLYSNNMNGEIDPCPT
jgi:hypothetical protein